MRVLEKKAGDMTFKEFWEEEKKKGTKSENIEKEKDGIIGILRKQGFSDQQINKMKMKKVSRLLWETMERQIEVVEDIIMPEFVKKAQTTFSSLGTFFQNKENWKLLQTDKGLRKDFFELAAGMDDLERSLFDIEEVARQLLEELKKKREESKTKKHG